MGDRGQACRGCWFFDPHKEDWGECRRHAPMPVGPTYFGEGHFEAEAHWPQVHGGEWCGEFRPARERGRVEP